MLNKKIEQYIQLHRALGFKYKTQSYLLKNYGSFAHKKGDTYVRTKTVLEWAKQAPSVAQRRNRLLTVRRFAIALQAEDNRYEVPPPDVFGKKLGLRRVPKILTSSELKRLLVAASKLKSDNTLRPKTYTTLFALLAVTGLRISEALALTVEDISDDGLIIRNTKFRKSRIVPIHKTTRKAIQRYLSYRAHYQKNDNHLFISKEGVKLKYEEVNHIFLRLTRSIGLRGEPGQGGVCIHDLRHRFAITSLEQCKNNDEAISHHIVALSTYLGHAHISDTYWYLHATPTLMKKIAHTQEQLFRSYEHE